MWVVCSSDMEFILRYKKSGAWGARFCFACELFCSKDIAPISEFVVNSLGETCSTEAARKFSINDKFDYVENTDVFF